MRASLTGAALVALTACAQQPAKQPTAQAVPGGSWMITVSSGPQTEARNAASRRAHELAEQHCRARAQQMFVTHLSTGSSHLAADADVELNFRCLDAGDPMITVEPAAP